jgi:hypothetical protein
MRRTALFTLAILLAGGCFADAVIWYRFDDQEPLTSTAAGVYVTNCVAATYPAHPRTIHGATYDDENSPNTAYLPTYTNSAPAGYVVYDPVTGARHANRGCLHFHTTGSGDQKGGMLRVNQDAALNAITNLTLEAFVRLGPDVPITSGYMRPIILKANTGFQGTWGLHVYESNLFYRVTFLLDDGTTLAHGWGNGAKSARLDDGRWHHMAVTFDFGTRKVYSYVDYVRISTATMNEKAIGFYHPANSPLQIGGNASHSTRRHNGEIDEVRISDEALPPEKFLRYIPMREIDGDTMYYLPFDAGAEDWFSTTAPPINAATNAVGTITVYKNATLAEMPCVTNDVPGDGIRNGVFAPDRFANGGATHLPVTGVGAHHGVSFLLRDPNNLIAASNFTFEAFVKTDRQTTKPADSQYADSFSLFFSGYMKVLMNGGNNKLLFRYNGSSGMTDSYVARIDDGRWHHVAYVYDAAAETMTGYVDYKQVTTAVVGTGGHADEIRISGQDSSYQTLPGCVDEVRITRRALSPTEFLTTHDCVTNTTLAHADFEDGLDMSPDTGLIDAGIATARTGGSVPVLDASVPGRIALDGAAMQDVRDNRKSLRIDGGKIGWTDLGLLRQPTFTVEFFAKLDHLDYVANLIRLTRGESPDGYPAWALFTFAEGTADQLTVCAQDANELFYFPAHTFGASIADGKWHHWALTFDGTSGTNTVITLYRDYVSQGSRTLTTPINYLDVVNTLSIGGTSSNPCHVRGNFDELRVSEGVLPISAFLRAQPNGTMVIVR